jgi:hypothetical protein
MILKQENYRKTHNKDKKTTQSFCKTITPTSRTCRWHGAAASPLAPWIGRSLPADGKSPDLNSRESPPCTVNCIALLHHQLLHLLQTPPRRDPGGDWRTRRPQRTASARKEALRHGTQPSTTAEDDEHHLQNQIWPRLHLHAATGWVPDRAYTIYTPRNEVPPTSRRRSGRRRRGNRRFGEVDLPGGFTKPPSTVAGEGKASKVAMAITFNHLGNYLLCWLLRRPVLLDQWCKSKKDTPNLEKNCKRNPRRRKMPMWPPRVRQGPPVKMLTKFWKG